MLLLLPCKQCCAAQCSFRLAPWMLCIALVFKILHYKILHYTECVHGGYVMAPLIIYTTFYFRWGSASYHFIPALELDAISVITPLNSGYTVCMHTRIHTHTHTHTHTRTRTHTRTHTRAHTHTRTHTCVHTRLHSRYHFILTY